MLDSPGLLLSGAGMASFLLWCGFVAGFKLQEMVVGALATGLTVGFLAAMLHSETMTLSFRLRDLVQAWRLPAGIAKDCLVVTRVLLRDLAGQRAGSFYRACGFPTSRRDAHLLGRTALAVAYTTASPNMVVIGVDPAQSLMLFHQIERDEVPAMTRNLGAQG